MKGGLALFILVQVIIERRNDVMDNCVKTSVNILIVDGECEVKEVLRGTVESEDYLAQTISLM